MIRVLDKKIFFTLERIWFPDNIDNLICKSAIIRILRYADTNIVVKNAIRELNYTLISNLNDSEEELLLKMHKNVRYEVKKCLNEDVTISSYESQDIKKNLSIINDFYHTYMHFCDSSNRPGIKKDFDFKKIYSYIDNDCITVSIANFKNGNVYHMYVHDDKNTVLVYSVSDFRNKDVDRNLAGRANKLLHYKDMIYFKSMNLHTFDWGNVSSFVEPNGIDAFKMSFGGSQAEVYNIYIGKSFIGKILVGFKKCVMVIRRKK